MRALWIPVGFCFFNAPYHRARFAEARQGRNFNELRALHVGLLESDVIPGRQEVMSFWELLVRTRFDDQEGPTPVGDADSDEKFANVRAAWNQAGNPEIPAEAPRRELAAVLGLAALDVGFRDALLDASVEDPNATRDRLDAVLLQRQRDWGRYVLTDADVGHLAAFLAVIKPMGLQNPLEIFHQRAWIQPRREACPLGVSFDPNLEFAYLSHSALMRVRFLEAGTFSLDANAEANAEVNEVDEVNEVNEVDEADEADEVPEPETEGQNLLRQLREAGVLIERE